MVTDWIAPNDTLKWTKNSLPGGRGGTISPINVVDATLSHVSADDNTGWIYMASSLNKTAGWTPTHSDIATSVKIGSVAATLMSQHQDLAATMETYTFGTLDDGVDGMTDFYASWNDSSKMTVGLTIGTHFQTSANDYSASDEIYFPVPPVLENKKAIINGIQLKIVAGLYSYADGGYSNWQIIWWIDHMAMRIKYSPNGLFFGMG